MAMKFHGWLQLGVRRVYFATISRSCSTMFSAHPNKNICFRVAFILSSASAFNLDQSKNLLFGKELTETYHLEIMTFLWQVNSCNSSQWTCAGLHGLVILNPFPNNKF